MKQLFICDRTVVARVESGLPISFKEKLEVVRHLDKLGADVIALPKIADEKSDTLFVRTVSAFAKKSTLSVDAGDSEQSTVLAASALRCAKHPRLRMTLPMSVTTMEYSYHKKPAKMLEFLRERISACVRLCPEVEFCAQDATRAEEAFLTQAIFTAVECGAKIVTLCDSAAKLLPQEMGAFIARMREGLPDEVKLGVFCSDSIHMGLATSLCAVDAGAQEVSVAVADKETVRLSHLARYLKERADTVGIRSSLSMTEIYREIRQIEWILDTNRAQNSVFSENPQPDVLPNELQLTKTDTVETIMKAVKTLGYDLSEEDKEKVFSAFTEAAAKKPFVTHRELDAIIANVALQVPPTYLLESFVINSGNVIGSTAQITLKKDGKAISGFFMGDGPIDAAFRAIEQVVGTHYELDDFQINSVTEGHEAMGGAVVRLRRAEKLYSGNGISTDIIDASIRAFLSALNKIAYEEVRS